MREQFDTLGREHTTKAAELIRNHATALQSEGENAYRQGPLMSKSVNGALSAQDDGERSTILRTHLAVIDEAERAGKIRPEAAKAERRQFLHEYAAARYSQKIDQPGGPEQIIAELDKAPGTGEELISKIIQVESGGRVLRSKTSSAYGVAQFLETRGKENTWKSLLTELHPELVKGRSDAEIDALRADPNLSREALGSLVEKNKKILAKQGVDVTAGNIYLSHFLGPASAVAVAKAADANPNAPVQDVLAGVVGPEFARKMVDANRSVLDGKTAGAVSTWAANKMGGAHADAFLNDQLDPAQRQHILGMARNELQRRSLVKNTDFTASVADDIAAAGRVGAMPQDGKGVSDFVAHYGAGEGPKRYGEYTVNLQAAIDAHAMTTMNAEERAAMIAGYAPKPGPGFVEGAKRQDFLISENHRIQEAADRANREPERRALEVFHERVKDATAQAVRDGSPKGAISKAEFVANLGEQKGEEAWRTYTRNIQFGTDARAMYGMSPEDRQAMIETWRPTPGERGFAEKAEFQDRLIHVNSQIEAANTRSEQLAEKAAEADKRLLAELQADPPAYAIKYSQAVSDAWNKLSDAMAQGQTALDPVAAAREYAMTTRAEQIRLGVLPEKVRIVPESYATTLQAQIERPVGEKGADKIVQRIAAQAQLWGAQWPEVVRQMKPGALLTVLGAGARPAEAQRLADVAHMTFGEIVKDEHAAKAGDIRSSVNDALAPFATSLRGNSGGIQLYNDVRSQVEKLAAAFVFQDNMDPAEAAKKATEGLVNFKYEYRDTYRIPSRGNLSPANVPADDIQMGAAAAKRALGTVVIDRRNLEAATREMDLTGQERALYERHLTNLVGPGGVNNPDGSRSTLYQVSFEAGGRTYNVPTVYDGKILPPEEAIARARAEGLDKFPSYKTQAEAEARYQKMHGYMEKDTGAHLKGVGRGVDLSIKPAMDATGFYSPAQIAAETADVKRRGEWTTNGDETGLWMVYGGQVVRRPDGEPLSLTWDQLARLGDTRDESMWRDIERSKGVLQ